MFELLPSVDEEQASHAEDHGRRQQSHDDSGIFPIFQEHADDHDGDGEHEGADCPSLQGLVGYFPLLVQVVQLIIFLDI